MSAYKYAIWLQPNIKINTDALLVSLFGIRLLQNYIADDNTTSSIMLI